MAHILNGNRSYHCKSCGFQSSIKTQMTRETTIPSNHWDMSSSNAHSRNMSDSGRLEEEEIEYKLEGKRRKVTAARACDACRLQQTGQSKLKKALNTELYQMGSELRFSHEMDCVRNSRRSLGLRVGGDFGMKRISLAHFSSSVFVVSACTCCLSSVTSGAGTRMNLISGLLTWGWMQLNSIHHSKIRAFRA